jgi:hypothetical protein
MPPPSAPSESEQRHSVQLFGVSVGTLLRSGGYAAWREASLRLLAELTVEERAAVLGANEIRFYRLDCQPPL